MHSESGLADVMTRKFSNFPIIKVSATGNDFLLVDLTDAKLLHAWQGEFGMFPRSDLAKKWCDRHNGLGADGLVILESDPELDFHWDFYNSDGGNAEMCGNAARAVSLFMSKAYRKSQLIFGTRAGQVEAKVDSSESIDVTLPAIKESEWNKKSPATVYDFIRAGVPHAVVKVPNLTDKAFLRETARALKAEKSFENEGVNVTFVQVLSENHIASITFERGVEDFTLACGTGAVAAAYSLAKGEDDRELEVQVPGGQLFVVWKNGRPHLRGPAKVLAEMRVLREA